MTLSLAQKTAFVAVLTAFVAQPAHAQSVRVLGEHNAWSAYETTESTNRICFVLSRPTATEPATVTAEDAYFYITHRPALDIRSEINLVVGDQQFALLTQDDAAWLAAPSQAQTATQAIRAGATMTITGTTPDGQTVTQTFSLSGATAASTDIDEAC